MVKSAWKVKISQLKSAWNLKSSSYIVPLHTTNNVTLGYICIGSLVHATNKVCTIYMRLFSVPVICMWYIPTTYYLPLAWLHFWSTVIHSKPHVDFWHKKWIPKYSFLLSILQWREYDGSKISKIWFSKSIFDFKNYLNHSENNFHLKILDEGSNFQL